jgi:hypothetical protein
MRNGLRVAAATALCAATVGVAAAAESTVHVPKLVGKPRTHAEALLAERGLRYKQVAPSARYELPAGVDGTGDALTVVPEGQTPDRIVTGQDLPPGTPRLPGDRVEFSTSPLPAGNDRGPYPVELARTSLAGDGRSLTVRLANTPFSDACRPLDHVDVAPRKRYVLVTPYVNLTDDGGECVRRRRTVSLELGQAAAGRPFVERVPTPPRDNLFDVRARPWTRARLESGGRYAVVYFWGGLGCDVLSHATVTPRGEHRAALTLFSGNASKSGVCPAVAVYYMTLVRIPDALVGRRVVDGGR